MLANYLMIHCWKNGADFAVVQRDLLEWWLKIGRFEESRKNWIESDIRPWFPHSYFLNFDKPGSKFGSLYASRKILDNADFDEVRIDEERIKKIAESGTIGVLVKSKDALTEVELVKQLALVAVGLSDVDDLEKSK